MNKCIKKAALMIPLVKKYYQYIIDLRTQVDALYIQNKTIKSEIEFKLLTLESIVDNVLDSVTVDKKFCPICNNEFQTFLPFGEHLRKNARCPCCHSLERYRAWWFFYTNHTDLFNNDKVSVIKVLHFAPEKFLYDKFSSLSHIDYWPVDIDQSVYGIRDVIDIQNIRYQDETFDIIICNHVLEHIPDDHRATKELLRVLKKDGIAYITCPLYYSPETTLEISEYNTPELRLKYYGQHDHLRKYGKDFSLRLERDGFIVKTICPNKDFTDYELSRYGIRKEEKIFQCTHA